LFVCLRHRLQSLPSTDQQQYNTVQKDVHKIVKNSVHYAGGFNCTLKMHKKV